MLSFVGGLKRLNDDQINEKGRRRKMSEKYSISTFSYFCFFSQCILETFRQVQQQNLPTIS
jgi:hypothetical protein